MTFLSCRIAIVTIMPCSEWCYRKHSSSGHGRSGATQYTGVAVVAIVTLIGVVLQVAVVAVVAMIGVGVAIVAVDVKQAWQ